MTYFNKKEKLANKVGRIDVVGDDDTEMADKVVYKNIHSTISQLRSRIQSTQSGFKLIRFNNSRRGQVGEPVEDKDTIADVVEIPGDADN